MPGSSQLVNPQKKQSCEFSSLGFQKGKPPKSPKPAAKVEHPSPPGAVPSPPPSPEVHWAPPADGRAHGLDGLQEVAAGVLRLALGQLLPRLRGGLRGKPPRGARVFARFFGAPTPKFELMSWAGPAKLSDSLGEFVKPA